ncbi:unnamed protein product, partial [Iphiclides podalirius]
MKFAAYYTPRSIETSHLVLVNLFQLALASGDAFVLPVTAFPSGGALCRVAGYRAPIGGYQVPLGRRPSHAVTLRGWRASGISVSECVRARQAAPPAHRRARLERRREPLRSQPAQPAGTRAPISHTARAAAPTRHTGR